MKFTSKVLLALSALTALAVSVNSCGGNSAGLSGDQNTGAFAGITQGSFKAVRYNDAGYRDGSLNSTLNMNVADQGSTTVVTVSISDNDASRGVTLDLHYDPQSYSPADVNFNGLINTPVQMSVTGISGLVALGQVDTKSTAVRHGQFATVVFDHKPFNGGKSVLAVHSTALDATYTANSTNFSAFNTDVLVAPLNYTVRSLFATGDGDANGESNISDLTPIGSNFGKVIAAADLYPASADYDANGEVNISDLTPLGAHFGQNTTGIEILLGDAATGGSVLETMTWASGTAPTGNPSTATADPAATWRTWVGDITAADCLAADTNTDGTVFLSARATDGTTPGTAFSGIAITYGPPPPVGFVISGINVKITGATGGTGATTEDFLNGDTASVVANSTETLDITGISGTFNATPFTPADAGGAVPQTDYDSALAAAIAGVNWVSANAGDANMRATAPVLALSAATGSGITATAFPDDDPESTGASAEGTLTATTTVNGTFMPGVLTVSVGVDVTVDAVAPTESAISSAPGLGVDGNGDTLLNFVGNSTVTIPFDWGSGGAPGTIDGTTIACNLWSFEANAEVGSDFTFVAGAPVNAGEFTVLGTGPYLLTAIIAPSRIAQGGHYDLRIKLPSGQYNSVNKPGTWFSVAPAPLPAQLAIFPDDPNIDRSTPQITVIWPDPVIRRDANVKISILDGSVTPDDAEGNTTDAFNDMIKTSGNEFQVGTITGTGLFPTVTIVAGNDPSAIGPSTDDTDALNALFLVTDRDPDKIVLDSLDLPAPANVGDPGIDYAFKIFGPPLTPGDKTTRPSIGFANFTVQNQSLGEAPITVVDWGVNAFTNATRGDLGLGSESYALHTADSTTFIAKGAPGFPDVLFVKFSGGLVGTGTAASDVNIKFHSQNDDSEYAPPGRFKVVCAGLDGGLNYIGAYVFDSTDLLSSGLGGNLAATINYDVSLRDGNDVSDTAVSSVAVPFFVQ